jgi:hypothetical protein
MLPELGGSLSSVYLFPPVEYMSPELGESLSSVYPSRQAHTFAAGTLHTHGYPLFIHRSQQQIMADLTRG